VKVLDIDRERQRISLGLKQTQSDPWQQVVEAYGEGNVVEGRVTKVVTFGAFVEILPGVEGLVHISELAQHHVENPREVVSQGDVVNVKVIEIDADRRRLSLSLKRVEEGEAVQPRADGAPLAANLDLSEDVFGDAPAAAVTEDVEVTDEAEIAEGSLEAVPEVEEPVAEEAVADEPVVEEPAAVEAVADEPVVEEPAAEEAVADEPVVEETATEAEPASEAEAEADAPAAVEEPEQPE
jgi:small subunit ribosomal protein S1